MIIKPDYKKIFLDIIHEKFPMKKQECMPLLRKDNLSAIDILELNQRIFGISNKQLKANKQKHRSYDKNDILQILDYQKKHKLTNSQLAIHFGISRNTISKWRRFFDLDN